MGWLARASVSRRAANVTESEPLQAACQMKSTPKEASRARAVVRPSLLAVLTPSPPRQRRSGNLPLAQQPRQPVPGDNELLPAQKTVYYVQYYCSKYNSFLRGNLGQPAQLLAHGFGSRASCPERSSPK